MRQKAKEVALSEIGSKEVQTVIEDMKKAVLSQDDGVAIAAPQIGASLRIFVVSGRAEQIIRGEEDSGAEYPDRVFINPVITKRSKDKSHLEEGCLSVRYLYGKVERSNKVHIDALDENGKKISRGASGLMAQIFQHEVDHLDGILFIDSAKDVHELTPQEKPSDE